jgi:Peptidogalycan biosysnthesis/recognition
MVLQGEHKIARGYLPQLTFSSHFLRNPAASALIQRFLLREAREVEHTAEALTTVVSPYKSAVIESVASVASEIHAHVKQIDEAGNSSL